MLKQLDLRKEESGLSSLSLTKGISLNLTKDNESLKNIEIGLGWQTRMDLDSIAILMDKDNNIVDTIYFRNKKGTGIKLNGDDLTGGGNGDNEIISANLSKIPKQVVKICLFANIFSFIPTTKTFGKVKQSYIRLVNAQTKEELCKYSLEDEFKEFSVVHFADLVRDNNNDWSFITIGKGLNGSVEDIEKYCLTGEIKQINKLAVLFVNIFKSTVIGVDSLISLILKFASIGLLIALIFDLI